MEQKQQQDLALFVSFCIEEYKVQKGIQGAEAWLLFQQNGLIDYLCEHYEVLHTQSRQWLMEEIEAFLQDRTK